MYLKPAISYLLGKPVCLCQPSNTALCTNLQYIVTEETSELVTKVISLAHFKAKWYKNQLDLEITQLSKIFDNAGEAFADPMHELVNKYADASTKPGKPIARDIKHKIELLDPSKPMTRHRLQRMSEKKVQKMQNHLKKFLEKGWIWPSTS